MGRGCGTASEAAACPRTLGVTRGGFAARCPAGLPGEAEPGQVPVALAQGTGLLKMESELQSPPSPAAFFRSFLIVFPAGSSSPGFAFPCPIPGAFSCSPTPHPASW